MLLGTVVINWALIFHQPLITKWSWVEHFTQKVRQCCNEFRKKIPHFTQHSSVNFDTGFRLAEWRSTLEQRRGAHQAERERQGSGSVVLSKCFTCLMANTWKYRSKLSFTKILMHSEERHNSGLQPALPAIPIRFWTLWFLAQSSIRTAPDLSDLSRPLMKSWTAEHRWSRCWNKARDTWWHVVQWKPCPKATMSGCVAKLPLCYGRL